MVIGVGILVEVIIDPAVYGVLGIRGWLVHEKAALRNQLIDYLVTFVGVLYNVK